MFKKRVQTFFTIAAVVAVITSCSNVQSRQTVPVKEERKSIHVLELFTSEGCSSCPPADRLLSKLKAGADSNVFVLSYHVDYWDYLGWKDPFSQAAFSERQRQYAKHFGLDGSYTPQLVVNGEEEFVGSDEGRLQAVLAKRFETSAGKTLSTAWTDKNNLQVSYSLSSPAGLTLNVALVQNEASTQVMRGENGGRKLQHVNVVRDLKTTTAKNQGAVSIQIPDELKALPLSVIVFVQQQAGGKISGAAQAAVPLQKGA